MKTRTKNALMGTRYNAESAPAICALVDYAAQNPGMEAGNYISGPHDYNGRRAYRQETAAILRDWQRVKRAVREADALGVSDAAVIEAAPRAFSGRLTWETRTHMGKPLSTLAALAHWSYCTGQYWPTEYRKAVASVLEEACNVARRSRPARAAMPTTIAELRALNRENGGHWFSPGSMRFFGTRICSGVLYGRYFITRETNPSGSTRFSVRSFNETGGVSTVGEFHSHRDKADALAALKAHLSS